jgi:hypothetical protein
MKSTGQLIIDDPEGAGYWERRTGTLLFLKVASSACSLGMSTDFITDTLSVSAAQIARPLKRSLVSFILSWIQVAAWSMSVAVEMPSTISRTFVLLACSKDGIRVLRIRSIGSLSSEYPLFWVTNAAR